MLTTHATSRNLTQPHVMDIKEIDMPPTIQDYANRIRTVVNEAGLTGEGECPFWEIIHEMENSE